MMDDPDARAIVALRNLAPALMRLWAVVDAGYWQDPNLAPVLNDLNAAAAREVGGEEEK